MGPCLGPGPGGLPGAGTLISKKSLQRRRQDSTMPPLLANTARTTLAEQRLSKIIAWILSDLLLKSIKNASQTKIPSVKQVARSS